jgi:hypothetical protein
MVCLYINDCKVVAFYPVWFGGPSACFALDQTMMAKLRGSTSATPVATKDQNSYWGLRVTGPYGLDPVTYLSEVSVLSAHVASVALTLWQEIGQKLVAFVAQCQQM